MAVKKITRFEVFKRDGFQCAYCGGTPPGVVLEIDHINPKSKGGIDEINNLITACFDCNRGKRDVPLDRILPKLRDNIEILKEKELQLAEYNKFIKKIDRRIQKEIDEINEVYSNFYEGYEFSDQFNQASLKRFLQSIPKHKLIDFLNRAMAKFPRNDPWNRDNAIRYFCGICWSEIKGTRRPD